MTVRLEAMQRKKEREKRKKVKIRCGDTETVAEIKVLHASAAAPTTSQPLRTGMRG